MSDKADRIWEIRKYIYDKVYQGYEREISTLWQRSVFLGAFILGIATAYGTIFSKALENDISFTAFWGVQILLCFISLLGIIFSILWVCMARASKANQEEFEMRLTVFGREFEISALNCTENSDDNSFFNKTGTHPNILGEVDSLKFSKYAKWCHETNTRFFSTIGGSFSVSKINIIIGFVFFFVFILLFLFHGVTVGLCVGMQNAGRMVLVAMCRIDGIQLDLLTEGNQSFFEYSCYVFSNISCFSVACSIACILIVVGIGVWLLLKKLLYSNHLNHRK